MPSVGNIGKNHSWGMKNHKIVMEQLGWGTGGNVNSLGVGNELRELNPVFIKRYKHYISFYFLLPETGMEFNYFRNISNTINLKGIKYNIYKYTLTTILAKDKRVLEVSSGIITTSSDMKSYERYAKEVMPPYLK